MSLSTKVFLSLIFGTVGAMLAWVLVDFNGFYSIETAGRSGWFIAQLFIGGVFGTVMGIAMGTVNGLSSGSLSRMWRNIGWGAVVGLGGGILGLFFGQKFFGALYIPNGMNMPLLGPIQFMWDIVIRALGWALIGLFVGTAQGFANSSPKMMRHGAIGGFIGGFLGGTLFEIVPYILPSGMQHTSIICRGISMTVTGAFVGFFIGLVESLMKQAWIRVVQGRNEGREYIVSKARTTIGRDELADVGLFGDVNVARIHAVIEDVAGGRHILRDSGSPAGTMVNGQKISEHLLRDGELIQIGSMRIEFHEKATASRVHRPVDVASKPPVSIPSTPGLCPFCGGKKDPRTGACACSFNGEPRPDSSPVPSGFGVPAPAPGPARMGSAGTARLVGVSGPYAGQTFPLASVGATSIGREENRNIQLSMDSTVSRRHGRIANEGGIYVVYDEGSSNGCGVNGIQVVRQELRSGDTVSFGSSSFRFEE
jgi:pSer/pThr/pTyr-binding forkhead associated (FHA) protein